MSLLRPERAGSNLSLVAPWLAVAFFAFTVWLNRVTSDHLLLDSDTRGILRGIAERGDPWSWFWSDWPLFNHFYRPIPTLLFEWDAWRSGPVGAGYGATNALLASISVALVAWVALGVFRNARLAAACSGVFAWWMLPHAQLGVWLGLSLVLIWIWAGRQASWERSRWWASGFALAILLYELSPVSQLYLGTVAWLPGRTATTMTVFALAALGCLVRQGWVWTLAGLFFAACALCSYEQAVMLPAIWLALAWGAGRPKLLPFIGLVALVLAYVGLREAILPAGPSPYQDQQFRIGPGLWMGLADYVAPPLAHLPSLKVLAEFWFLPLLASFSGWMPVLSVPAYIGGIWGLSRLRRWRRPLAWALASSLAYAPLAFMHPFEHYHFLPMALRAGLVVSLWQAAVAQDEALE